MTQEKLILTHLNSGQSISPLEALNRYGIMRLAPIVHTLRQKNHRIAKKTVKLGRKHFASYYIERQVSFG